MKRQAKNDVEPETKMSEAASVDSEEHDCPHIDLLLAFLDENAMDIFYDASDPDMQSLDTDRIMDLRPISVFCHQCQIGFVVGVKLKEEQQEPS